MGAPGPKHLAVKCCQTRPGAAVLAPRTGPSMWTLVYSVDPELREHLSGHRAAPRQA